MFGMIGLGPVGRFGLTAAALGGTLLLTACVDNIPSQERPCPMVRVVQDASYMTRFAGGSEDLTQVSFEARIAKSDNWCKYLYTDTETQTQTFLNVTFAASRGPQNVESAARFNYFVRVTGPGGTQLQSQLLDVDIPFTASKVQNALTDEVEVRIPLKQGETGDYYRIYVGLAVSEQELSYNRRNPLR